MILLKACVESPAPFLQLERSVTQVDHSAWPVKFKRSLKSFQHSLDDNVGLIAFVSRIKQPSNRDFLVKDPAFQLIRSPKLPT